MTTLTTLDWAVVGVYFLVLLVIVVLELRRQRTATDYFLAGRNIGFFAIGGSIFASNIGSEHIVGLAGQGASTGLAVAHYELASGIGARISTSYSARSPPRTCRRRGALFGALLKLWPVLIFLVPGMIGAALDARGALAIPTGPNGEQLADQVFPTMVATLLPAGLRGLVVAALLAALMSSLSSLFNSTATLFTVDVYEKLRPQASQARIVLVGRLATLVVTGLGLLWIPVMPLVSSGGLYQYLQNVQSYLAPPITAVFLLGLTSRRINAAGAAWGLGLGFLLGIGKLVIQAFFGAGKTETPAVLAAIGDFNFLYFSGALFLVCVVTSVVASLLGEPQDPNRINGLTFATLDRAAVRASVDWKDVAATAVVLALVAGLYLYFSFWIG